MHIWTPASFENIPDFVDLEYRLFWPDLGHLFVDDFHLAHSNYLVKLIQNRDSNMETPLVFNAYLNNKLLAYTVAVIENVSWTTEPIVCVKILGIEPTLSARLKIQLVKDAIDWWHKYAKAFNINVILSSTLRKEQSAFLKLHERAGFEMRGSFAIKRLSSTTGTIVLFND